MVWRKVPLRVISNEHALMFTFYHMTINRHGICLNDLMSHLIKINVDGLVN